MDKKTLMEELEQLGKLYQAGVFSQAEFEAERAELLAQLKALRCGQTPMPSAPHAGGIGQAHGADVFATGFAGNQGGTSLGVGGVVGERCRLVRMFVRWLGWACVLESEDGRSGVATKGRCSGAGVCRSRA